MTDANGDEPRDDTGADSGADEEWRFGVDEVGDDGAADGDDDGNVAGSLLDLEGELEPGTPTLEGTVFVVLGALVTVLLLLEAGGVL